MSDSVRNTARELLPRAVQATKAEGLLVEAQAQVASERPKCPEHGDYAPQEMKRAETAEEAE